MFLDLSIPPIAFRILARDGSRPLSHDDIAKRSGLSRSTVQRTSELRDWSTVKAGVAKAFIVGCGFDPARAPHRQWERVVEQGLSSLKHLKPRANAKPWELGVFGNRVRFIHRVLLEQ